MLSKICLVWSAWLISLVSVVGGMGIAYGADKDYTPDTVYAQALQIEKEVDLIQRVNVQRVNILTLRTLLQYPISLFEIRRRAS